MVLNYILVGCPCRNSWEEISSTERTRVIIGKLRENISDLLRKTLSNSQSHTLRHVNNPASLQPSQILSYPFSPKKSVFDLKEKTEHNADQRDTYAIGYFFAANGRSVFSILATSI